MRQVGTPLGEVRAPRAPRARHHVHAVRGIDQQRFEAGDDQVGDYGRRTPVHQQESQGRRQQDDKVASCQPVGCFFEALVSVASLSTSWKNRRRKKVGCCLPDERAPLPRYVFVVVFRQPFLLFLFVAFLFLDCSC